MATTLPQTSQEAEKLIRQRMRENYILYEKAVQLGDKEAANKYSKEQDRLNAQLRSTATISVGGTNIPIGAIGSGLQSGISGLFTGIPDIAIAGYNLLAPKQMQVPSLGTAAESTFGLVNQPTSEQARYPFAIAQGAGGSALPGAGTKGLLLGTGLSAADVAAEQATLPAGAASMAYLGYVGFKGIRGIAENRKFKQFLNDLPPDEANVFREFMLRGQGSDSPLAAVVIQKLRTNPQYAELFAKLDEGARQAALKGVAPVSKIKDEEQAAVSIAQRIQNEMDGLREQRSVAANNLFETAKAYGADRPIVGTKTTVDAIDSLISDYQKKITPNADRAVQFLNQLKSRLTDADGNPIKATIEGTQSVLAEFGKKAAQGDSLVKDLAISDERRISSAIFGSLKTDLQQARLAAVTPEDKAATGLLLSAREQVRKASDAYLDATAQGLPNFLKDKSLRDVNYDDLYAQYKNLNPTQRAAMRSYVQTTDTEALKFIDKNVFDDFVNKAKRENDAGIFTTDLGQLAKNWQQLGKNEKDSLTTALGTNAADFEQRMKDASIFSRRMSVAQPAATGELIPGGIKQSISALAGVTPGGYQAAKGAQLALEAVNMLKTTGLTDDQLMRVLLTKEGADFLKSAALTPYSQKTLDALTQTFGGTYGPTAMGAASRVAIPGQQEQQMPQVPQINIPTEFLNAPALQETQPIQELPQIEIPQEFLKQPVAAE